ncbi:TlpA family protein disulfide reductase [Treponema phagedenis]|uniref:TlpA family protein disulfide reductase n=1 Tax=Treponema phagedenis TaxID=162 RepID=A0AAE6M6Z3_TREPH|nr:TlpA disulfide reductase family protein [Treponema phagedenis]EFW37016.1 antioxidant, AhpC/TSA family [Treponema phagedenis F0421]QEJ97260.1 TlpA family protein disulfide reductase [Treponema phagedenis]QEK01800.1 TlpA family protein disulfide reductase [Treponema phagedenis]QEK02547.1 TlpA family protein disulfide reductase [Treponema phagedenis]QEK06913.1 TlpA family protein disulfide reductase [Treponema phagedenis]
MNRLSKNIKTMVLPFMVALFLFGCSEKEAQADSKTASGIWQLEQFRFYIYPKPMDIPEDFSVEGLKGGTIKADDLHGKITLLNFWATWCPPCRAEMPSLEKMHKLMKGTDFQIVAVDVGESKSQVEAFISKEKYSFPVYLDESGTWSSIFASRGIPTTYVINKERKIVAVVIGGLEYDQPEIIKIFKELANE